LPDRRRRRRAKGQDNAAGVAAGAAGDAAAVRQRLSAAGYGFTEARSDLAGIARVVVARRDA